MKSLRVVVHYCRFYILAISFDGPFVVMFYLHFRYPIELLFNITKLMTNRHTPTKIKQEESGDGWMSQYWKQAQTESFLAMCNLDASRRENLELRAQISMLKRERELMIDTHANEVKDIKDLSELN